MPWIVVLPMALGCASREALRHGSAPAPEAWAAEASAQRPRGRGRPPRTEQRPPAPVLAAGVGFTVDPGTLLLVGEADFPVTAHSSVGPLLQLGITDDRVLFAPAGHFRHEFALPPSMGLRGVVPWVQAGAGLLYLYEDQERGSHDDLGPVLILGAGVEWRITSQVSLRSGILLDVMPVEVLNEHLIVSVELFALSFRM